MNTTSTILYNGDRVMANNTSIGLGTILVGIFAAAKVFGFTDWSWVWVFSPIWIPFLAIALIGLGIIFISGALAVYRSYQRTKRVQVYGR